MPLKKYLFFKAVIEISVQFTLMYGNLQCRALSTECILDLKLFTEVFK